jgi:hypothetical protein
MDNTTAESAANGIGSLAGIKSKNSILMVMNYTFIIALSSWQSINAIDQCKAKGTRYHEKFCGF